MCDHYAIPSEANKHSKSIDQIFGKNKLTHTHFSLQIKIVKPPPIFSPATLPKNPDLAVLAILMIAKTSLRNIDTITQKNSFDAVGTNGFIQIEPPVLKFCGYQLDEPTTLTVKIINKAPIPQRVHILPPENPCFSIRCDKKGQLSTGMAEVVQVTFSSNQYKYHYDSIKIHTETENFAIPLHAFPVMTKNNLKDVFPKLIDFGNVVIGESQINEYPLVCDVPLKFEYEFVVLKPSTEIMIEPMSGVIPARSSTSVTITFAPTAKITSTCEVQFRLSQFDFKPIVMRIVGSGKEKLRSSSKIRIKPGSADPRSQTSGIPKPGSSNSVSQNNTNTLLLNNTSRPKTKLSIGLGSAYREFMPSSTVKMQGKSLKQGLMSSMHRSLLRAGQRNTGTVGLADEQDPVKRKERHFLERFNEIQKLDKQKDIKFFVQNGDSPMTPEEIQAYHNEREAFRLQRLKALTQEACSRYTIEFNNGQPVVEREKVPQKEPTYSIEKNDDMGKRRKLLKKLMSVGSRVLVNLRMMRRLRKIKQFLEGCTSKLEATKKIEEDHNAAEQRHSSGDQYVEFKFSVSTDMFDAMTLPLQFQETSTAMITKSLPITPLEQFDDLVALDNLVQNEVEVMDYASFSFPQGFVHAPKNVPSLRYSGEEEFPYRGPSVPIPEPILLSKVFSLPLDLPSHCFISEDSKIKKYKKPAPYDEKDIQYCWHDSHPVEDEIVGWQGSGERDVLKAKFMRNFGCEFQSLSGFVNSEANFDAGFLKSINRYCPKIIPEPLPDDPFSDNDSDNDEYPAMPVQKVEDQLAKIQGTQAKLSQKRKKGKVSNDLKLQVQGIQKNLSRLKKKWTSTPNTVLADWNKWISVPQNKQILY